MKITLCLALALAVAVSGNPAANSEWRWSFRMPTASTNPKSLNFEKFMKTVPKQPRVPGTKIVQGCGPAKQTPANRIVNGAEAVPHSYPWQVALFFDGGWFCGGSIISDEYILTAAHCTDGAGSVDVVVGAHDLTAAEDTQQTITATDITTNADYNSFLISNDVGLIKLPSPLTFDENIAPICLPSYSDAALPVGTLVTASGWGKTKDGIGSISDTLNEVTNEVTSAAACSDVYGAIITDKILCTDTTGGQGTCNGDSGGPLSYVSGGVAYSRGVTSFVSSSGCSAGLPDGFSRTIAFLDWIETNSGIAIDA